ncbi:MAG: TlpA disulfide reductase family protein [Bacteroidia bacterium]|nr:TlpA disulfide reductase family protein [Bacteroidia bacterium]
MKNYVLGLLWVLFSISAAFAQGTVTVSGKIENPAGKTVSVYYYPNLLVDRPVSTKATLDEEGKFQMSFQLASPVAANFSHGREQTAMFIHPGDNISLSLNPEKFDETITYKGDGPGVDASNCLAKYFLKFEDEGLEDEAQNLIKEGLELEYAAWINRTYNSQVSFLSDFAKSHKLSEAFMNYAADRSLYVRANRLMQFPSYHAYLAKKDLSEVTLSKNYYDFLGEIRVMNDRAASIPEYISFVQNYISWKMAAQYANVEKEPKPEEKFSQEYQFVTSILQGESRLLVQASMLKDILEYGNPLIVEGMYAAFVASDQKGDYSKILKPIYDQAMLLAPGQPAPEFSLLDINGARVSLNDFRGKVVYLDFWASWCGPCRREMPASKRLSSLYRGKDVVFVYISIDDDEAAWRNAVKEDDIQGVLLFSQGGNSEVPTQYGVKAIPKYFMINRDGTIAHSNPSRPSGKDIEAQLEEALKMPYDQDR